MRVNCWHDAPLHPDILAYISYEKDILSHYHSQEINNDTSLPPNPQTSFKFPQQYPLDEGSSLD